MLVLNSCENPNLLRNITIRVALMEHRAYFFKNYVHQHLFYPNVAIGKHYLIWSSGIHILEEERCSNAENFAKWTPWSAPLPSHYRLIGSEDVWEILSLHQTACKKYLFVLLLGSQGWFALYSLNKSLKRCASPYLLVGLSTNYTTVPDSDQMKWPLSPA